MPGSSEFNAMDSGMRRNDGLIRRSLSDFMAELVADPGTWTQWEAQMSVVFDQAQSRQEFAQCG
jgi:hypothetical protein